MHQPNTKTLPEGKIGKKRKGRDNPLNRRGDLGKRRVNQEFYRLAENLSGESLE